MRNLKLVIAGLVVLCIGAGVFVLTKNGTAQNTATQQETIQPLEIPPPIGAEKHDLIIEKADEERLAFKVELAVTPAEQSKGLMFRENMPEDEGMLFVFPKMSMLSFWMKNTLIPLDMIFIGEDGTIVHIHENAVPHDLTSIGSQKPAKAVLEINGGLSSKLGIRTGDKILFQVVVTKNP